MARTLFSHEGRTEKAKEFFEACIDLQETKGKDYTTDDEAFKDLKEEAEAMGVEPEQVLWIAMNKHYKAVRRFCRDGQTESEPIESRLKDLANYVSLIAALLAERELI